MFRNSDFQLQGGVHAHDRDTFMLYGVHVYARDWLQVLRSAYRRMRRGAPVCGVLG